MGQGPFQDGFRKPEDKIAEPAQVVKYFAMQSYGFNESIRGLAAFVD